VSTRLRAALALVLIVLFPVFVLLLLAGVIGCALLIGFKVPVIGLKIGLIALPLAWALWQGVSAAVRATRSGPMPGVELTRAEHPALWQELDELTAAMGQQPVDRTVVQPITNAAVTEVTGRRELAIGLPFLAAFDRAELRAVLAHELGHFQRGHTRGGLRAYRANLLFGRTLEQPRGSVLFRPVAGYYRGYLGITVPLLRERECEADEWSARLAGPDAAVSVLSRVDAVGVAWDVLAREFLPDDVERTPSPAAGLRLLLAGPLRPKFDEVTKQALDEPAGRYDSHPGAGERIARIRSRRYEVPAAVPSGPASSLLGRGEESLARLEHALQLTGPEVQNWDAAISERVLKVAREQADSLLGRLAEVRPGQLPSPAGLLEAIAAGQGPVLVAPLVRGDVPAPQRPEVHRAVLAAALQGVLLDALQRQDRVRVRADWGADGPVITMLGPDGSEQPFPSAAVRTAIDDPAAVGSLAAMIGSTGVDLALEPSRPVRTGPVGSVALGALTDMFRKARGLKVGSQPTWDLIAYDDGLLLSPASPQPLGESPSLTRAKAKRDPERLARVLEQAGRHPARWAVEHGARWIPFQQIASSRWDPAAAGWRLRLHGGESLIHTRSRATSLEGEPWAVVGRAISG
jgi:Zn-dependent protease with chaperone function